MSTSPVLPGTHQDMPKGKPLGHACPLCGKEYVSGHLVAGVFTAKAPPLSPEGTRVSDEGYYEGHYACVVEALGEKETLKAVQQGRLPAIDPDALVDGCLPRHMGGI